MVHIGNKIKEVLKEKGLTVSEFSRRINTSRENIYGIFKRKTIDTGLLVKISNILGYNFFRFYIDGIIEAEFNDQKEPILKYNKKGSRTETKYQNPALHTEILIKENEAFKKENEYLKEINALLKEKTRKKK